MKFIILLLLFLFVVFKVTGFILRNVFSMLGHTADKQQRQDRRKSRFGNIHVDYVPPKDRKDKHYDGGEYVNYEEVKD